MMMAPYTVVTGCQKLGSVKEIKAFYLAKHVFQNWPIFDSFCKCYRDGPWFFQALAFLWLLCASSKVVRGCVAHSTACLWIAALLKKRHGDYKIRDVDREIAAARLSRTNNSHQLHMFFSSSECSRPLIFPSKFSEREVVLCNFHPWRDGWNKRYSTLGWAWDSSEAILEDIQKVFDLTARFSNRPGLASM